jgi:23S rRNA (cytosine1962-C5)-methyltransferase
VTPGGSDPGPVRVRLRPGREASVDGGHPWIFSGAIDRVDAEPEPGAEVQVLEAGGRPIARGLWNPHSQIRIRVYSGDPERPLDRSFWAERLDRALAARRDLPGLHADAPLRLVFSEADGLSGLVVDRFDRWLVVQFTALALHERLELLLELLDERLAPAGILLRTERGMLDEEGLEASDGVLRGREPEGPVSLLDAWGDPGTSLRFLADLRTGQKTGFYLDQRMNRRAVARWAGSRRVADVCCYSGGFALHAAAAGASAVVGVDTSAPALELARANAGVNGLDGAIRWEKADALGWLRAEAEGGRTHDLVVLDPPRFARSRRGVSGALRGYGRLNEAALRVLEPGGLLATFSCSGRVGRDAFIGVLAGVSARTGRRLRILESYGQPGDHPVDPNTPETAYLKGLLLRVE